jgi:4-methylaminobutanoate oxidase (formaldehyde-forming)
MAAIDPATDLAAHFTIESKGTRYAASVSRRPFYDPRGERLHG